MTGFFTNIGKQGIEKPNIGTFISNGGGSGLNASADLFGGFVLGGLCDFEKPTLNFNAVAFGVSVTILTDADSENFSGITVGK
ncbi:MAG: hypothetical protein GWN01_12755, partial [Nitrosopumilaceae archaeon]|nr:hypothetical protein [Nitrosopumilaceae archaeon]NIU88146.1 hypothetical protein [Nitrosopumilaceae archaeon]NIX62336.1 hypothetical protein [Nitrosopumilaceae archaeon]